MKFLHVIGDWINAYFSNEDAIYLIVLLVGSLVVVFTLGGYLAPVLTGLVVAFLLQGLVATMERKKLPRILAVSLVFAVFVGLVLAMFLFGHFHCSEYWTLRATGAKAGRPNRYSFR